MFCFFVYFRHHSIHSFNFRSFSFLVIFFSSFFLFSFVGVRRSSFDSATALSSWTRRGRRKPMSAQHDSLPNRWRIIIIIINIQQWRFHCGIKTEIGTDFIFIFLHRISLHFSASVPCSVTLAIVFDTRRSNFEYIFYPPFLFGCVQFKDCNRTAFLSGCFRIGSSRVPASCLPCFRLIEIWFNA